MRNKINQVVHVGLFLVLLTCLVSAIGCAGGGAQSASGSPSSFTPSPSPLPSPSAASLSATPSSLGFGSQVLNTAMTQTTKITNTGTVAVAITQDSIVGPGFSVGITTPINLNPAQSVNVPVVFNPAAAGTVNGSLSLMSNGSTVLSVPLAGTGLAPQAHSVDIAWDRKHVRDAARLQRLSRHGKRRPLYKDLSDAYDFDPALYRYNPGFRQAIFLRRDCRGYQRHRKLGFLTGCCDHSSALKDSG